VAEDVRRGLASVGLRSLEDAVGRVDLLRRRTTGDPRADLLELDSLVELPGDGPLRYAEETPAAAEGGELDVRLAVDAAGALRETRLIDLSYRIRNRDRAVGANLGGRLGRRFGTEPPPGRVRARFEGAAGQSFGAFLARGIRLGLTGEANDYVGKGMSGGRIAIRPPAGDVGDPVLVGNTVLYGATGGELFCAGRVAPRQDVAHFERANEGTGARDVREPELSGARA
jgi:glutamate synthase domain-containing protein 3